MTGDLLVKDLHVSVEGKEILKGLSLEVNKGEVHALMGPNGSGKSTFANTLMGHPKYEVTKGDILFKGESVLEKETDERARMGLFMAFQYPVAIPGLTFGSFLRAALNARLAPSGGENGHVPTKKGIAPKEFRTLMRSKMALVAICRRCKHRRLLYPANLIPGFGEGFPAIALRQRLRCSACGGRTANLHESAR